MRSRGEPEQPKRSRWQWLRDAFSLEPDYEPLSDEEVALLDRIAGFVVRRRMVTPALLFLESVKPLSYVGSQAMAFFEPIVRMLFAGDDYAKIQRILERRASIETLMLCIERADARQELDETDAGFAASGDEAGENGPDDTPEAR